MSLLDHHQPRSVLLLVEEVPSLLPLLVELGLLPELLEPLGVIWAGRALAFGLDDLADVYVRVSHPEVVIAYGSRCR